MNSSTRPTVFVSYSHRDEVWKDRLVQQLRVLELEGDLEVWDDRRIDAGDDWQTAIEAAMAQAQAAVLLVSADFLTSKFILGTEVPELLRRRQSHGLRVIPVIVRPCPWQAVAWLSKIQCRPTGGKELASFRKAKAEKHLAELAAEIRDLLLQPTSIDQEELDALAGETGEEGRPPISLPRGAVLQGNLVVSRVLGTGSFGITYLSWDRRLKRKVAIKEYLPRNLAGRDLGDPQVRCHSLEDQRDFDHGLRKFLEEAQVLANLKHANIVKILHSFPENKTAYFTMDYDEGETLEQYLEREKRLPAAEAIRKLLPVLEALVYIHSKGLVHRDVKPSNIYLKERRTPILLDFGAARHALWERTRSSLVVSSGYAPIEQYNPHGQLGPWTDVYAAAATLYRMLTGKKPPEATSRADVDVLESPDQLVSGLPSRLSELVQDGLAVNWQNRIQDAGEFFGHLRAVLNQIETPEPLFDLPGHDEPEPPFSPQQPLGKPSITPPPASPTAEPEPASSPSAELALAQKPLVQESNDALPGKMFEMRTWKKIPEATSGAVENILGPPDQLGPGLSPRLSEFIHDGLDGKQTVLNKIEPPEPLSPIDMPELEPGPAPSPPPGELAIAQMPSKQKSAERVPGETFEVLTNENPTDAINGKPAGHGGGNVTTVELESAPSQPTGALARSKQEFSEILPRRPYGAAHVSLRTRLEELLDLFRGLGGILVVVLVAALLLCLLYLSVLTIQPVAMPDEASAKAGEEMVISVLSNDWTRIGTLRLSSVGEPSAGKTRQRPDGTVIYSPPLDFSGSDRFTYRVTNSWLGDSTEVRVTVQGLKAGDFRRNERDGLDYSWIPRGQFQMGCTPGEGPCEEDEGPPHAVALAKGFWLGTTEVTAGAFYRYRLKSVDNQNELLNFLRREPQKPQRPGLPERNVTWAEADAFCRWSGGRLPTEAEWEYAARGGKSRKYPWGNEAPVTTTGAHNGAAFARTDGPVEVGSFGRNAFQLFDMAGNVYEWCQDTWHKSYNGAPPKGAAWISRFVSHRVIRGGSWKEQAESSRTASRTFAHEDEKRADLGFRCARDAPPHSAPKPPSPVGQ